MTSLELLCQRLTEAGATLARARGPAQLALAIYRYAGDIVIMEDHSWLRACALHFPNDFAKEILFIKDYFFNSLSPLGERVRVRGELNTTNGIADLFDYSPPFGPDTAVTIGLGAIPETGSVLISSGSPQAFHLSLCLRRHIVVIPDNQASLTMAQALALTDREPSGLVTWLTGPSRTADIEKVLVLGAQGAAELMVILYQEK
jgi:L-lactate dehydrogenase complex protein LldG